MDKVIYWLITALLFASAWGQWVLGVGVLLSTAVWCMTLAACVLLLRFGSRWDFCMDYVRKSWEEFEKISWSDVHESRALSVTVSLMIAVLSVMLWLMDQMAVLFLTRWV